VRTQMLTLVLLVGLAVPIAGQSTPDVQGVWRAVEMTIPAANEAARRRDPFGAFSEGSHTALQPQLMIVTAKHDSRTTDTGAQPRPTIEYNIPGRPTLEELQAEWGPFVANAGTYLATSIPPP